MKCDLDCVSEQERGNYIKTYCDTHKVIFFGDGLGDLAAVMKNPSVYFIAPNNARTNVQNWADYVTPNNGGEGAFLDLAEHIVFDTGFIPACNVVNLY